MIMHDPRADPADVILGKKNSRYPDTFGMVFSIRNKTGSIARSWAVVRSCRFVMFWMMFSNDQLCFRKYA